MIVCSQPECQTTAGCKCNLHINIPYPSELLAAKDKEIEALRKEIERRNFIRAMNGPDLHDKAETWHKQATEFAALADANEARAETAERKAKQAEACCDSYVNENQKLHDRMEAAERRVAELEEEKHQLLLEAIANTPLYSRRKLEERLKAAERERDAARAALKPFLPDTTLMDILWGDMDDEATGTHTVKLKHFRAARAVIKQGE